MTGPFAPAPASPPTIDGRRARGMKNRAATLQCAVQLASRYGLEGLTIGQLAAELGVSKSSAFALFGSKEELQLATLDTTRAMLINLVIGPALQADEGLDRLRALGDVWCDYLDSEAFSGGCPLCAASAEMDGRLGPVRDAVRTVMSEWLTFLVSNIRSASAKRQLRTADPEALAFRLNALGMAANWQRQLFDDPKGILHARAAWHAELDAAQLQAKTR